MAGPAGGLDVRNHVDVEDYLKGMAEVPGTWPAAAVQAQAIAARTYALRAMAAGGTLCDTDACQVYAGTARESAGQVAAVDATRGLVVTYGGRLAATFYSASAGGFTATAPEGFGSDAEVPYLTAHPYATVHPEPWAVDIALTDVARRLGYPGLLHSVEVDQVGPSGRPLHITLDGDAGPRAVDPQVFRRRLGLRSTLFSVVAATSEVAPPPPPEEVDAGVVGAGDDPTATDQDVFRVRASAPPGPPSMLIPTAPAAPTRPTPFVVAAAAVGLLAVAWTLAGRWAVATGSATAWRVFPHRLRAATMTRWTNRSP